MSVQKIVKKSSAWAKHGKHCGGNKGLCAQLNREAREQSEQRKRRQAMYSSIQELFRSER